MRKARYSRMDQCQNIVYQVKQICDLQLDAASSEQPGSTLFLTKTAHQDARTQSALDSTGTTPKQQQLLPPATATSIPTTSIQSTTTAILCATTK